MNFPETGIYSYALYQFGSLVYRTGKYPYKQLLAQALPPSPGKLFFDSEGMNHYLYRMDKSRVLIVSRTMEVYWPGSLLFLIFLSCFP